MSDKVPLSLSLSLAYIAIVCAHDRDKDEERASERASERPDDFTLFHPTRSNNVTQTFQIVLTPSARIGLSS